MTRISKDKENLANSPPRTEGPAGVTSIAPNAIKILLEKSSAIAPAPSRRETIRNLGDALTLERGEDTISFQRAQADDASQGSFPDELPMLPSFRALSSKASDTKAFFPNQLKIDPEFPESLDNCSLHKSPSRNYSENQKSLTDDGFITQMAERMDAAIAAEHEAMQELFHSPKDIFPHNTVEKTDLEPLEPSFEFPEVQLDDAPIKEIAVHREGVNTIGGGVNEVRESNTTLLVQQVQMLQTELTNSQSQQRALMTQLKNEKLQLVAELQQAEAQLESERNRLQEQGRRERDELAATYQSELERLEQENEMSLVQANEQAAKVTEISRQKMHAMRIGLDRVRDDQALMVRALEQAQAASKEEMESRLQSQLRQASTAVTAALMVAQQEHVKQDVRNPSGTAHTNEKGDKTPPSTGEKSGIKEHNRQISITLMAVVMYQQMQFDDIETELLDTLEDIEELEEQKTDIQASTVILAQTLQTLQNKYVALETDVMGIIDELEDCQDERNEAVEHVEELELQVWSLEMQISLQTEEHQDEVHVLRVKNERVSQVVSSRTSSNPDATEPTTQNESQEPLLGLCRDDLLAEQVDLESEKKSPTAETEDPAVLEEEPSESNKLGAVYNSKQIPCTKEPDIIESTAKHGTTEAFVLSKELGAAYPKETVKEEKVDADLPQSSGIRAKAYGVAVFQPEATSVNMIETSTVNLVRSPTSAFEPLRRSEHASTFSSTKSSMNPNTASSSLDDAKMARKDDDPYQNNISMNERLHSLKTSVPQRRSRLLAPTAASKSNSRSRIHTLTDSGISDSSEKLRERNALSYNRSNVPNRMKERSNVPNRVQENRSKITATNRKRDEVANAFGTVMPSKTSIRSSSTTPNFSGRTGIPTPVKRTSSSVAPPNTSEKKTKNLHASRKGRGNLTSRKLSQGGKIRSRLPTYGSAKSTAEATQNPLDLPSRARVKYPSNKTVPASTGPKETKQPVEGTTTPKPAVGVLNSPRASKRTSPKDLIREYLSSPRPQKPTHSEGTPPSIPLETIDEPPKDASPVNIGEKFECLFNVWSTAKKKRNGFPFADSTPLPPKLVLQWPSTTKVKRQQLLTESGKRCARKRFKHGDTPDSFQGDPFSQKDYRDPVSSQNDFGLSILNSSDSPEQLLVSPMATSKVPTQTASRMDTERFSQSSLYTGELYVSAEDPLVSPSTFCIKALTPRSKIEAHSISSCIQSIVKIQALWRRHVSGTVRKIAIEKVQYIQSAFRGAAVRRKYRDTLRAIRTMQSVLRRFLAQTAYRRKIVGITRIEAVGRGFLARKGLRRSVQQTLAATVIQTFVRRIYTRTVYRLTRFAVVLAQAHIRRTLAKKMTVRKRNSFAALRFQRTWRGFAGGSSTYELNRCATLLQSFCRRHLAHTTVNKILVTQAVVRIQTALRGRAIRKHFVMSRESALTLQTYWRNLVVRRRFIRKLAASLVIQRAMRSSLKKRCFRRRNAAICIQTCARTRQAQQVYRKIRKGTIVIQTELRKIKARHHLSSLKIQFAATLIQKNWRKLKQLKLFKRTRCVAILCQSMWRGQNSRKCAATHQILVRQVTMGQAAWRRYRCGRAFQQKRATILIIQAAVRGKMHRQMLVEIKKAVIHIQKRFRGFSSRSKYLACIKATTKIQSFGRMVQGRAIFNQTKELRQKAVYVQKHWRRACTESKYLATRSAAIGVQSAVRRHFAEKHFKRILQREMKANIPLEDKNREHGVSNDIASHFQTVHKTGRIPFGSICLKEVGGRGSGMLPEVQSVFSPLKTRRGKMAMITDSKENGGKNSMKSSCTAEEKPAILHSPHLSIKPADRMKVVELRDELTGRFGLESKDIRKLRKAELTDLLVQHRESVGES
jgi:hypothetical protein